MMYNHITKHFVVQASWHKQLTTTIYFRNKHYELTDSQLSDKKLANLFLLSVCYILSTIIFALELLLYVKEKQLQILLKMSKSLLFIKNNYYLRFLYL